jgi:hypothetical protein
MAPDGRLQSVVLGRGDLRQKRGAKDVEVGELPPSDDDALVLRQRPEGLLHVSRQDPPLADVLAKEPVGKIPVPFQIFSAEAYGLFKREVFQAMKGIVMDEGPHRPVRGDDLAGEADQRAELHPLNVGIGMKRGYRFHVASMTTRVI